MSNNKVDDWEEVKQLVKFFNLSRKYYQYKVDSIANADFIGFFHQQHKKLSLDSVTFNLMTTGL